MEERKNNITQKELSITLEELKEQLKEWKKDLTPEDIKSIINFIEDPVTKLIAQKLLILK